jgi:hypothetical protein
MKWKETKLLYTIMNMNHEQGFNKLYIVIILSVIIQQFTAAFTFLRKFSLTL